MGWTSRLISLRVFFDERAEESSVKRSSDYWRSALALGCWTRCPSTRAESLTKR